MAGAVTLALIPAPDIPEKIAKEIAEELPGLLAGRVDAGVSWDVPVVVDPSPAAGEKPRRYSTFAERGC